MERIKFYKHINKKIVKGKRELIFHNFDKNYYDVKNNKIRIGIKDANVKKFKEINKRNIGVFDVIDMRFSLRYGYNDIYSRKELFNFVKKHLEQDGDIYCFINREEDLLKVVENIDIINKGDEIWIPQINSNNHIDEIIVKYDDKEEIQYAVNLDRLKEELKMLGFRIVKEYSLNKMKNKNNINFIGEYIIKIKI